MSAGRPDYQQLTVDGVGSPVPWKPSSVEPPAGSEPFQAAAANVVVVPDVVGCELHAWATVPPGSCNVTCQVVIGSRRAVTRTDATNSPGHRLATVYVAVRPRLAADPA